MIIIISNCRNVTDIKVLLFKAMRHVYDPRKGENVRILSYMCEENCSHKAY